MSDAAERHVRHQETLDLHESRLDELEGAAERTRIWRTGNGAPHRGAEARITRVEEGAIMKDQLQEIIDRAVSARQRSLLAIVTALAPYAVLAVVVAVWIVTGKPPQVTP